MLGGEGRHDRREPVHPERVGRRDDDPSREGRAGAKRSLRLFDAEKHRARASRKLFSGTGQMELPRRAMHERGAELLFQPAQVTAGHRQGESQRARGSGDAPHLRDAHERRHLLEHRDSLFTVVFTPE
jgi:hypothetical protein